MIRHLLEALLVIRFVRYEGLTGVLFRFMARRDGHFSKKEAARLWREFDTTSAPAVKGFILLLEKAYGIRWREKDFSLKEEEKRARRVRSDIIHAKGPSSRRLLLDSLKTVRRLIKKRKEVIINLKRSSCRLDTESMRREIRELTK